MKKKLIRVADQILTLEEKLQAGENMAENLKKLESLTSSLSEEEIWQIDAYLEEKLAKRK